MVRKVWFQLVDEESRHAFAGAAAASVQASVDVKDVEDFRNKVHAEFDHTQPPGRAILAHLAPIQLKIYKNTAAYEAKDKPLEEDSSIGTLGDSMKNALIVEVPKEPKPLGPDEKRQRTEAVDPRQLNELVALVQQLGDAKEVTVGKVLDTPTTIFGTSIPDGLYIRQEYWDLYDIIKQRLSSDRSLRRILVVGSPGIGKSVFGVFLLLLFMTEQKDVAYRRLGDKVIYFTWNTDGYKCSRSPHAGRTYDGFFDGNEAGEALWLRDFNRAFLFASPRTKNYNEFVKAVCFKVYMNPWTKVECQTFADAIHVEDQDEWLRRFALVGGKPRFVFSSSESFDHLVNRVKKDIPHNISELKDQVRLFEQNVFDDRMKHLVFHLYRDVIDPSDSYLAYSSLAVEAIMNARYQVGSADEIRSLLQTPAPNLQSWRGKEIEKFLLQELPPASFV